MNKTIDLKAPSFGISGEFKYKLYDQDDDGNLTLVDERDWSSNTIVDYGLTSFTTPANPTWFVYASVGADGSPTNPASSTLNGAVLGDTSAEQFGLRSNGNEGANDYEFWMVRAYRLVAGVGTGPIQEAGLGSLAGGTGLFTRHVVSPQIDKGATQVLDVFYKLTCWPSLIDVVGTSLIGGVNYDTATSFYNVDAISPLTFVSYLLNTSSSSQRQYDGVAAGLTDNAPSGSTTNGASAFNSTPAAGSRNCGYKLELDDGITTLGFVRTATSLGTFNNLFQTEFTAQAGEPNEGEGIPKTVADELTLNWQLTWGEKP
jgi:hypothetical protein